MYLPTNKGMELGDRTKEDQWAGPFDKDYGEFYKKMSLGGERVSTETILFLNFWGIWRKMMFAVTVVFFEDSFRLQAGIQFVGSAVMMGYLLNYWPCARYIDNVSKVVNELTITTMLLGATYLKEVEPSVREMTPSNESLSDVSSKIGTAMIVLSSANLIFHCC